MVEYLTKLPSFGETSDDGLQEQLDPGAECCQTP